MPKGSRTKAVLSSGLPEVQTPTPQYLESSEPEEKTTTKNPLKSVMLNLKKTFGDSIMLGSDLSPIVRIPTNHIILDKMLLNGGFPQTQTTVLWGPPKSGKSTLSYDVLGHWQTLWQDGVVIIINAENSFDKNWAELQGMDMDRTIIISVSSDMMKKAKGQITLEQLLVVLDAVIQQSRERGLRIIAALLDSMQGLNVEVDEEKASEGNSMAGLARRMSKYLPHIIPQLAVQNAPLILIGQTRSGMSQYEPEVLSGGWSVKHNVRLNLHMFAREGKSGRVMYGNSDVGHYVRITAKKINHTTEGEFIELPFLTGKGFDDTATVIDLAVSEGIILESGLGRFEITVGDVVEKIHGKAALYARLLEDATLLNSIRESVIKKFE